MIRRTRFCCFVAGLFFLRPLLGVVSRVFPRTQTFSFSGRFPGLWSLLCVFLCTQTGTNTVSITPWVAVFFGQFTDRFLTVGFPPLSFVIWLLPISKNMILMKGLWSWNTSRYFTHIQLYIFWENMNLLQPSSILYKNINLIFSICFAKVMHNSMFILYV